MTATKTPSSGAARVEITTSRQFTAWMAEQEVSLALTTYQAGKFFLLGRKPDGSLEVFNRNFERCMGLCFSDRTCWLSSLYQLWRFENVLEPGQTHEGYDRVYVPQVAYTTGDLDIHDVAVDGDGQPVFVNTLFSCLATISETHSFRPLWRPPFVSRLAAEDRCHLNGLAMRGGRAAHATAASRSDLADGWRDHRRSGGVVIDVASNEIVLAGLSMPHSPRWHGDRLWLLDSGNGYLGYVDAAHGRFEPVTLVPGYGRGLAFTGDFAVVATSGPRHNRTFAGLALEDRLAEKQAQPRCGLFVVDLRTGDVVHWLRLEGVIDELYDVAVLPGITRPMAIGLKTDEIRRVIGIEPG